MNRQQIINATHCPICNAEAGERCKKRGKPKKTVHSLRVQYATGGQKMTRFEIQQLKKRRALAHRSNSKSAKSFYASWEWKKLRYEAIKMHGRKCQCCGWRPGDTEHGRLVVDHVKPRSKYPKLQLSLSNLQVLCSDCNMGKSNVYEDDFRDEWQDAEGDPLTKQFMDIMQ